MRPSVEIETEQQYECVKCGERTVDPTTRACDCGGTLQNLTRSRDL